ncbi:MAG: Rrf2 family transcriptional regulator [Actinomycetota bacterium]|nr:Rrf2 family transcriptional regulator [Actinomycetota bacterium]
MMKLSTKGRYGVRAMIELALNYGCKPLLLREIANRQDISEGYLEHILPLIKKAGLVGAVRGANGGYFLAKSPNDISLGDIIRASEGNLAIVDCVLNAKICERNEGCVARDMWKEINDKINDILDSFSLQEIVDRDLSKNDNMIPVYHI